MTGDITSLEQMLNRIAKPADDEERVSLGAIVETVGGRSFGPLLVTAGIIMTSPLSGVPGMPTIMGILLLLIAVQLLMRRKHFWLPRALLQRSVAAEKLKKGITWLLPPARFIDRLLRPRLLAFTHGWSMYAIAIVCVVVAATMPLMELVPFSVHAAGVAVTAFGLSLIARDGLLALVAFAVTAVSLGSIAYNVLW